MSASQTGAAGVHDWGGSCGNSWSDVLFTGMAYTTSPDGTRIHYEEHGRGVPVLLIMGLGSNAYGWHRTIPWLAEHHHVIAFDNRGTGRSGVPEGRFTIAQMAADAVAVLDATGIARAHVAGASLGGMIAQRVALAYPERVRSLILACTTPGGARAVRASNDVMAAMVEGGEDPATLYRRSAWFLYGEATRARHPERIEEDLAMRSRIPTSPAAYLRQFQAAMAHDTWDELPAVSAPTLVVHGDADLLIPFANGELLAQRIPAARLVRLAGSGHMLQSDAGDALRDAVLGFLAGVDGR